ncbi:MAG: hypothetical protein H7Z72_23510 [Bacteroidetes bacterium]|nr:hypothetical protein [Fibrella sp.]
MQNQPTDTGGSTAETLLDATISAFDPGKAASPQEGLSLIADWFSSLNGNRKATVLVGSLNELQAELQGTPSNDKLKAVFGELADQTETLAKTATGDLPSRLETLAHALRNFSDQLSTAV